MEFETNQSLHSAEYFGNQRNFWWNQDFLSLMTERWNLKSAQNILDVGCGIGHWGMMLFSQINVKAKMVGIDREQIWVDQASKRAFDLGISNRISYQQGTVENLPFDDKTFDVVTCQTLLIHMKDVQLALSEMLRVLRVGGRLCIVEPNNLARTMANTDILDPKSFGNALKRAEFQMVCEFGKYNLGLGHNSFAELIPEYLSKLKLKNISMYMSDKCFSYVPPYKTPSEQAHLEQDLAWAERDFWIWSREETYKYYRAGGGSSEQFESLWAVVTADKAEFIRKIENRTYVKAGGGITYLFHAEKYE
jgi:ubiquinone/menaquinone biosynthesis C-methylase UbiE